MRETHADLPGHLHMDVRMNFPTVPIAIVPAPDPSSDAGADRPVVLVVDHDPGIADAVSEILNQHGYAAIASYDAKDAIETALLIPPELVIADVDLPGMNGIAVAGVLRTKIPDCKVLLLSGNGHAEPSASAKSAGRKLRLIDKPVKRADLLDHVSASLKPK